MFLVLGVLRVRCHQRLGVRVQGVWPFRPRCSGHLLVANVVGNVKTATRYLYNKEGTDALDCSHSWLGCIALMLRT